MICPPPPPPPVPSFAEVRVLPDGSRVVPESFGTWMAETVAWGDQIDACYERALVEVDAGAFELSVEGALRVNAEHGERHWKGVAGRRVPLGVVVTLTTTAAAAGVLGGVALHDRAVR